jgi:hypothetical protein
MEAHEFETIIREIENLWHQQKKTNELLQKIVDTLKPSKTEKGDKPGKLKEETQKSDEVWAPDSNLRPNEQIIVSRLILHAMKYTGENFDELDHWFKYQLGNIFRFERDTREIWHWGKDDGIDGKTPYRVAHLYDAPCYIVWHPTTKTLEFLPGLDMLYRRPIPGPYGLLHASEWGWGFLEEIPGTEIEPGEHLGYGCSGKLEEKFRLHGEEEIRRKELCTDAP